MSETAADGARLRGEGAQGGRRHRHSSASCSRTGAWKILERDELAPEPPCLSSTTSPRVILKLIGLAIRD
jgi:hypothetical protein